MPWTPSLNIYIDIWRSTYEFFLLLFGILRQICFRYDGTLIMCFLVTFIINIQFKLFHLLSVLCVSALHYERNESTVYAAFMVLSTLLLWLASRRESSGVNFYWLEDDLEWHVMKHNVCCKVLVVKETEGFINICTVCIFTYFWSNSRELWQLCNTLPVTVYCAFEINCNLTLVVAVDSQFYWFLYAFSSEI
jgi:hypothetical protein